MTRRSDLTHPADRRMPWWITLRRWWPCWRLTRHRLNYYHSSTREWAECYCGRKKEQRP